MSNDNNYMCLNDEYEYLKNKAEKQKNFYKFNQKYSIY